MLQNQTIRAIKTSGDLDLHQTEITVGIRIFDFEHREMMHHLRRLCDGLAEGRTRHQLHEYLSRLIAVTKRHFIHEEDYMRMVSYGDFWRHAEDHRVLAASLQSFVDELEDKGEAAERALAGLRTFFKVWLLDHVLEYDRSLANFLVQRGIR
jgi:hemerythrin